MKNWNVSLVLFIGTALAGCVKPVDHATRSLQYSEECAQAEAAGDMILAVDACYRAYEDWGNRGSELRSLHLYNFGRVLRKAGKYDGAREVLLRSVAAEETLTGSTSVKASQRLAELSATYYEMRQIPSAIEVMDRLVPNLGKFAGSGTVKDQHFIASLLYLYAKELGKSGQIEKSNAYLDAMKLLGLSAVDFGDKQ